MGGYIGNTAVGFIANIEDNSITASKIKDGVIEIADIGPVLQEEIDSIYTEDDYIADEMVDMGWSD